MSHKADDDDEHHLGTDTEISELPSPTSEQELTITSAQQLTVTSQDLTVTSTAPLLRSSAHKKRAAYSYSPYIDTSNSSDSEAQMEQLTYMSTTDPLLPAQQELTVTSITPLLGVGKSDYFHLHQPPLKRQLSNHTRLPGTENERCLKTTRMATSLEDITSLRLWKGIIAEFVGVLLLVLVGCGSCIALEADKQPTTVQIALCFGLSVATIVWNIAHVSGGHINPAVTLALLATRKISLVKAIFFVLFQLVGAVVGAGILLGLTPVDYHGSLGATLVSKNLDAGKGLGVEMFITFVLVFTVFASIDAKRKDINGSTPLTIGLSVTMCHLFAIQYTGSSMNTARSFGPALVTGNWENHWVYWVGPIGGGVAAGLLYEYLFAVNASLNKMRSCVLTADYDDEKFAAKKIKVRILEVDPEAGEEVQMIDSMEKVPLREPPKCSLENA